MPNYDITVQEVEALRKAADAGNLDAVVFVADTAENVLDALKAVVERAQEAVDGVPAETRTAKEDATTGICVQDQELPECTLKQTYRLPS